MDRTSPRSIPGATGPHETLQDILAWLTTVLSRSRTEAVLVPRGQRPEGSGSWRVLGSLFWLALPDGGGCLIPTDPSRAAIGLELLNPQTTKTALAKMALAVGIRFGIQRTFPHVDILTAETTAGKELGDVLVAEHLKKVLGIGTMDFAVRMGSPSTHRKPLIQLIGGNSRALGYAKIGTNTNTNSLVANEARTLEYLEKNPPNTFYAPKLLHGGQWEGHRLCVQSAPGNRAYPASRRLDRRYLDALREMASIHATRVLLTKSPFWIRLQARIDRISNPRYRGVVQSGIERIRQWVGDTPLLFHFCHGDFVPWNAQLSNGKLRFFDWEYSAMDSPAGWDLMHFWHQTHSILEKRSPHEMIEALQTDRVGKMLADHLRDTGAGSEFLQPLLLTYLVERLAFYASMTPPDHDILQRLSVSARLASG